MYTLWKEGFGGSKRLIQTRELSVLFHHLRQILDELDGFVMEDNFLLELPDGTMFWHNQIGKWLKNNFAGVHSINPKKS